MNTQEQMRAMVKELTLELAVPVIGFIHRHNASIVSRAAAAEALAEMIAKILAGAPPQVVEAFHTMFHKAIAHWDADFQAYRDPDEPIH